MSRTRLAWSAFTTVILGLVLLAPLRAQTYALQLINNDPEGNYSGFGLLQQGFGINDYGHVVGIDSAGSFLRIGASFTPIVESASCGQNQCFTVATGVNNSDTVVGYYFPSGSNNAVGFSWSNGNFTPISISNATQTYVTAISNKGTIAGYYISAQDNASIGFILNAGALTTVSCGPVWAVNNSGQAVGISGGISSPELGFFYNGTTCSTFSINGSITTEAFGINDSGQIYGHWVDAQFNNHGFRMDPGGNISILDFADDSNSGFAGKINNSAQVCGTYVDTSTGASYPFVLSPSALVDPIPDLLNGAAITADADLLASLGTGVLGVGADGVTQVVVRLFASAPGQQFTLTLLNDHVLPPFVSSSPNEDGGLGIPGGSSFTQNQITITSQNTNAGPQAFAIYQAPIDFMRPSGTYLTKSVNCPSLVFGQLPDDQLACREVNIQVQGPTGTLSVPVQIIRPPIVAVHGIWGDGSAWVNFFNIGVNSSGQTIPDPRFSEVEIVNYDTPVGDFVTSTDPAYDPTILSNIQANALGLQYNVAKVKKRMAQRLSVFKKGVNAISAPVAAVQVDVVAHSMGGVITRTLALQTNNYLREDNFLQGDIHKMITIVTPHLGTPLTVQLDRDENSCVRGMLAWWPPSVIANPLGLSPSNMISIKTAVLEGDPSLPDNELVFGATGDLEGNGSVVLSASFALQDIATAQRPIPTALIGAIASSANLAGLDSSIAATVLQQTCTTNIGTPQMKILVGDPLAVNLTSSGWPNIFNEADSDGIVPLTSQLNRVGGFLTTTVPAASLFNGYVHSPGTEKLGFAGPSVLDDFGNVPLQVINLLNTPVTDPNFNPTNP